MPFDGIHSAAQQAREQHAQQAREQQQNAAVSGAPIARRRWREALGGMFGPRNRAAVVLDPEADPEPAALRLLEESKRLIEAPERWTQGMYWTLRGHCAIGALRATARRRKEDRFGLALAHGLLLDVAIRRGFPAVQSMNDQSTHRAVLSAFDEAIAEARRRTPG